jgi:hypothetical protein
VIVQDRRPRKDEIAVGPQKVDGVNIPPPPDADDEDEIDLAPPDLDRHTLFGPVVRHGGPVPGVVWIGAGAGLVAAVAAWVVLRSLMLALPIGIVMGLLAPALLMARWTRQIAAFRDRDDPTGALDFLNGVVRRTGVPDQWVPLRIAVLSRFGYFDEAVELIRARRRFVSGRLGRQLDERLGVLLVLLTRDLCEAEELLRAGLERSPRDAELSIALGVLLWQKERYVEAVDRILPHADRIATWEHARRASIYYALGESLARSGRGMEAAPWFRQSTEWDAKERDRRIALGRAMRASIAAARPPRS